MIFHEETPSCRHASPQAGSLKNQKCEEGNRRRLFWRKVHDPARRNTLDAATPQHLIRVFLAGLRAWKFCCLAFPGSTDSSGIVRQPHFLTVAGAAPELIFWVEIAPASRLIRHSKELCADTTNGAQYIARGQKKNSNRACQACPVAVSELGVQVILWRECVLLNDQ